MFLQRLSILLNAFGRISRWSGLRCVKKLIESIVEAKMRIAYWTTSCLQPEIEAVSKEVFQLAEHFDHSLLFGINPHYVLCASLKKRYIGFHPRFDPILRTLIPFIERYYDVSHVYGEVTPWTFYKTLRRKPIVLTVASEKGTPKVDFLKRCRKVIVQTSSCAP